MKKSTTDYSSPTNIFKVLSAIDLKDYKYFDNLTEEQQKEISPYLLLRWNSTVHGNNDISKYYALSSNSFINENFWDYSNNKKFCWLLLCASSPGIGKQKHYWLGSAKGKNDSKLKKILLELLPNKKENDIDLMLKINSKEEIFEWLRSLGWDEQRLKELK
jgi:hypothetical protein